MCQANYAGGTHQNSGKLIILTSLMSRACSTTSVRPLSCSEDKSDGSWKTYTVTTSVAVKIKQSQLVLKLTINKRPSKVISQICKCAFLSSVMV